MYDVIVIGARCAGASTAMLLARKGYRVLLADRSKFPKEIPHGHFIHRGGPQRLNRWGLLDRIVSAGCPPVQSMITDAGDFPLTGINLVVDGVALGYAPRRAMLDKILVDAAVEAGAELREEFVVEDLLTYGDKITGISGRQLQNSTTITEHATMTVGADGRNSFLAQTVHAPVYEAVPAATVWYFSYWSSLPGNALEVYVRSNRVIFAFPTNDGLFGIFVAWPRAELASIRRDIEGAFMAVLDQAPELAERVRSSKREERFYGATDLPNFLRKPFGPGWGLVGDAGCHKDPYLALGICDAFRDAEWLVEAIDQGLSGQNSLDIAMAEYERLRNEATLSDYHQNIYLAQFKPFPPDITQLRLALRNNQEETNRYYMANEGMIPRESFYNPANLQRIKAMASNAG
jgi:2-polyprenyl-6-methoxyphenol hydroxylase-like FAD-dependent oxidoreductase